MIQRWLAAGLGSIALLAGAANSIAAPSIRSSDRIAGRAMSRRLNLTGQQRQQIQTIRHSHRDDLTNLRQRLQTARTAFREAAAAAPIDEALVRQRRSDLSAVQADADVLRSRIRSEELQVLTPDQQSQLKSLEGRGKRNRRQR